MLNEAQRGLAPLPAADTKNRGPRVSQGTTTALRVSELDKDRALKVCVARHNKLRKKLVKAKQ